MGRAMIETDVAIVGAGGGGAVLALMLAQRGIRSLVLERATGPPQGLRGEILQPNGQQVLDRLGLLDKLPAEAVRSVRRFNFCRAGGERLCTVDYGDLPAPYNRALVTLPNVAHHAILESLERQNPGGLWYDATFTGLRFDGARVVGLQAERRGELVDISARLVVGADGAFSKVRDCLGIATQLHRYSEGYLIALLGAPPAFDEGRYLVGTQQILGLFPAAGQQVYVFYMIEAGSYEAIKARTRSLAIMIFLRSIRSSRTPASGPATIAGAARASMMPLTTSPERVTASARLNTAILLKWSPNSLTTCPIQV